MVVPAPFITTKHLMANGMMDGGYGGPPPDTGNGPEDETEMEGKTALLPKTIFPGEVEPGDTITLKVEAVYSDEVECSVASEETETEEAPMTADAEIEAAGVEME